MVDIGDIESAKKRIESAICKTPCQISPALSEMLGANIYLKYENMHRTGSFKERGALNRLLTLTDEEKKRGVVAASAGNHAQALALHATRLGVKSTIFMPKGTPIFKLSRTKEFGAEVRLQGENYDETYDAAAEYARKCGGIYVHAYDDEQVIAGQGTLALEIIDQMPSVDIVVVPVGGGGLAAGIAVAINKKSPKARIVGVEAQGLDSMAQAVRAGSVVRLPPAYTLAEGISVRQVGLLTSAICMEHISEWVTTSDNEIARSILYLLEQQKTLAEGAGAVAVAALMAGKIKEIQGKNICAVIGGGNIDINFVARVIERGLVESGRLIKLEVLVPDRPGGLGGLLQMVGNHGANVLEVHHERAFAEATWSDVRVDLVLEMRGKPHIKELLELIVKNDYTIVTVAGNHLN